MEGASGELTSREGVRSKTVFIVTLCITKLQSGGESLGKKYKNKEKGEAKGKPTAFEEDSSCTAHGRPRF